MIEELGIFEGERIARCSKMAQLYYPRLIMASNGFGRLRIDYSMIVSKCFPMWRREDLPTESELLSYIAEYYQHQLLFVYKFDGQTWGQFDVLPKTYGTYRSKQDKRSPDPPAEEWQKWVDQNRRHSSKKTTVTVPPSVTFDMFSENFEKFSNAVAVAVPVSLMPNAVAVAIKPNTRARNEETSDHGTQDEEKPEIPRDSDLTIGAIIRAHPRPEKPLETERAIARALDGGLGDGGKPIAGLAARFGDAKQALRFLMDRTKLYKECTDGWPPGEQDFIIGSPRWFSGGCYDEPVELWRRRSNDNRRQNGSGSNSKADRRSADIRETTAAVFEQFRKSVTDTPGCLPEQAGDGRAAVVGDNADVRGGKILNGRDQLRDHSHDKKSAAV
jgi:hypothetical protein